MGVLLSALIFSAFIISLSAWFQVSQRRARAARFRGLILKPNCLLTRYPIAFLSGPRTVFRLIDHWNDVPLYLREHGYEVYVIEPAGHSPQQRCESIRSALEGFGSRCHIIADGSLERDLEVLGDLKLAPVATLTVVKTSHRERYAETKRSLSPIDLKPRASTVEIFEIADAPGLDQWSSRLKLILLGAHNFLIKRRTLFVHPFETAEVPSALGFKSEERFLTLAISLAERDLIGSD